VAIKNLKELTAKTRKSIAISIYHSGVTVDQYIDMLYDHQEDAFVAINKNETGQIVCPTGSGKSKIQIATFFKHLENHPNEYHNYLIASHRLMLNLQLIVNLVDDVKSSVAPFKILFVGSGHLSADTLNSRFKDMGTKTRIKMEDFKATTNKTEINNFVNDANESCYDVLIVSTYHSLGKLSDTNIEIACFDEAHTTAGTDDEKQFKRNLKKLKKLKRKYFFTATRKVYGDDRGMNDSFYGDIIYETTPKDMMDGGYICEPKLHLVYNKQDKAANPDDLKNYKMEVKTILESFTAHNQIVKDNARRAGRIPPISAKMLVNSGGSGNMLSYIKSNEIKKYSKNNDCKMFFISANEEVGQVVITNGVVKSTSREEWMTELVSMSDEQSAIIFHYNILTEGIDLPNITGTLFTRANSTIKLMQSVGRSLRLLKEDRYNIFNNKSILPAEKEKLVKPHGYVILPEGFLIDEDDSSEMGDLIRTIINQYEIPEEKLDLVTTDAQGTRTINFDEVGTGLKDNRDKRLTGVVEEIYHEIEEANSNKRYIAKRNKWIDEIK
jgi:superfamily II DNA or RNA helicase